MALVGIRSGSGMVHAAILDREAPIGNHVDKDTCEGDAVYFKDDTRFLKVDDRVSPWRQPRGRRCRGIHSTANCFHHSH